MSALARWANFYVIVGSSAGALTGLQFVVIALVAEARIVGSMRTIRAFATPTVVDFCVALLISAVMSAPWRSINDPAVCLGLCGALGFTYSLNVVGHARKQTSYTPDNEDWTWYAVVPVIAYALLLGAAILMVFRPASSLLLIAATSLLFLFLGIRNAWDTVTYVALQHQASKAGDDQ